MLSDPKKTKGEIIKWIRTYFEENGPGCDAVIGISGGKDSSVVAALCVEALGKDRVFGVLMPQGEQADIADSHKLVSTLGIDHCLINIESPVSSLLFRIGHRMEVSDQARINLPARIRMATLYAVAQCRPNGGRVANTCNRSEDFVGYSTKFGDSAGDFSPLANLMVHEVIQIGHELGLPAELVEKTPSDGLSGKSDEDNLGVSYDEIDRYIESGHCAIARDELIIKTLHQKNLHKLLPMPTYI